MNWRICGWGIWAKVCPAFRDCKPDGGAVEEFCDHVAAEFLVPTVELEATWRDVAHSKIPFEKLARRFKVSPVVIGAPGHGSRFGGA